MTSLEPLRLREVSPTDLPALADLERAAFGADAWSAEAIDAELSGDGRTSLVAEDADGVVGYAVTRAAGDVVDLHRVVVADRGRRQGVASRLVLGLTGVATGPPDAAGGLGAQRGRDRALPSARLRRDRPAARLLPRRERRAGDATRPGAREDSP